MLLTHVSYPGGNQEFTCGYKPHVYMPRFSKFDGDKAKSLTKGGDIEIMSYCYC